MRHARCIGWGLFGAALGLGAVAHGQDPGAVAATDPLVQLFQLMGSGGLPPVLAVGFYMLGRTGIPVVVQLHEKDRALLEALAKDAEKEK
jgi:hypothetical protein